MNALFVIFAVLWFCTYRLTTPREYLWYVIGYFTCSAIVTAGHALRNKKDDA